GRADRCQATDRAPRLRPGRRGSSRRSLGLLRAVVWSGQLCAELGGQLSPPLDACPVAVVPRACRVAGAGGAVDGGAGAFGGGAEPVEDVLPVRGAKVQGHGGCRVWSGHSRYRVSPRLSTSTPRSIGWRPSLSICTSSSGASPTRGVRSRMSTE